MYAGHLGIGLAAKRARPDVPLVALLLAAQGCDWIDAILMTLGWKYDQSVPWSHSLPAVLTAAALVALLSWLRWHSGATAGLLALTYLSHIPADLLTGYKLLLPGWHVGLDMYSHPFWDFGLEALVVLGGWWLYRGTLRRDRDRSHLALLIPATLIALQLGADLIFLHRLPGEWTK